MGATKGLDTWSDFWPKKHPYFNKTLIFPLNEHPFFYQNIDIGWTGTRILTLDFIINCVFSGSWLGSPVTSAVTRRQSPRGGGGGGGHLGI